MIEKGIMLILLAVFVFMPMAIHFAEKAHIKTLKKTLKNINETLPDNKKRNQKELDKFLIKKPPSYLQSLFIGLNTFINQPLLALTYFILGAGIDSFVTYLMIY